MFKAKLSLYIIILIISQLIIGQLVSVIIYKGFNINSIICGLVGGITGSIVNLYLLRNSL